jgi:hypothetical protein
VGEKWVSDDCSYLCKGLKSTKKSKTVYMVNNTHNKQHSFVVLLSEPLGLFKLHHGLGKTRYLGLKRKIMNNAKGLI